MSTISLARFFDRKWTSGLLKNISSLDFWIIVFLCAIIGYFYYACCWFKVPFIREQLPWLWEYVFLEFRTDLRGSLFTLPVIYAAIRRGLQASAFTWLFSMLIIAPYIIYYSFITSSLIINLLLALLPLVIIELFSLLIMWRKRERENLAEREMERQSFIEKILRAQENERKRLTCELHDDTMQTLLVIAKRAHALTGATKRKTNAEVAEQAVWIRDATIEVSDNIERLCTELRPSVLDCMGLIPAITWLSEQLKKNSGTDCEVTISGKQKKLSPETEVVIFRIVQEGLNNIRLHSNATEASITLKYTPDYVLIMVQDNGTGFSLPKKMRSLTVAGHLGLVGMQQRANSLGSKLKIISSPGKGATILLRVPMEKA